MPKKDDDLIFDTPSLKPDREVIIDKQYNKSSTSSPATPKKTGGSFFKNVVLLFLCLAILGLTWNTMEMQKQLDSYQNALTKADMRIYELEKRSQKSSETQDITVNEIADRLEFFDKEIRKLWDNVWAKSKTRFSNIETTLKTNKQSLTAITESKKQLIKLGQEQQKTLKAITTDIKSMKPGLNTLKAHTKKLSQIETDIKQNIAGLKALETLETEQKDIQERLNSVDSFRRQINEQLEQIRTHLGL